MTHTPDHALQEEYGVDMDSFSGGGGGGGNTPFSSTSYDAPVIFGWQKGKRALTGQEWLRHASTSGSTGQEWLRHASSSPSPSPIPIPVTQSIGDAMTGFYQMDEPGVRDLQQRLFDGGFYGTFDKSKIRWGDHDEDTIRAYEVALNRAARFAAAGAQLTVDEVIDQAKGLLSEAEREALAKGGGTGRERAPFIARLPAGADVAAGINDVAKREIGRIVTNSEEMQGYIRDYQQRVQAAQAQTYNAAETGGVVEQPESVATFGESKLRQAHPGDAIEMDFIGVFNTLASMLSSRQPEVEL